MAPPLDRKKRQWNANNERNHHHDGQQQQPLQQVIANDLAFAATYAQIETPSSSTAFLGNSTAAAAAAAADDDNEISLEEGYSSDASSPDSQTIPSASGALNEPEAEPKDAQQTGLLSMNIPVVVNDSNAVTSLNKDVVDDDDDESDVDLAEAVARMEQDDDDGEDGGGGCGESGGAAAARTANEVDAYHVTVKQLEKVLGTSLSTKEWEEMHVKAKAAKLNQAGHVHFHLVEDRTIVVQSKEGVLLEEGNILVIKTAASSSSSSSSLLEEGWMPLGKIFEVFGPVSRPFYSVRLPDPPEPKSPPVLHNMPKEGTGTVDGAAIPCASSEAARLTEFEDPWEPNGKYTLLFRSSPKTLIYYLMDEATLINTNAVYHASGRGCDASNMHDEEVLNPKDLYYSDDDDEREATGKQRGRKQRGSGNITNNIMQHSEQSIIPNSINNNNPNPNRNIGGRGFIRPNPFHISQQVPGFHISPAMGTVASGFVQHPYHPMTANNNNSSINNNMPLAPFNNRDNSTTGQVPISYNHALHAAASIPQPAVGQQSNQQPPPAAEDTVYYDYS